MSGDRPKAAYKQKEDKAASERQKAQQHEDNVKIVVSLNALAGEIRATRDKQETSDSKNNFREWVGVLGIYLAAIVAIGAIRTASNDAENQRVEMHGQLEAMKGQLAEMKSSGTQTDDLIKETKKSADAAKQSADSTVALERPSFFVLVRVEGPAPKEGPFDSVATPSLSYTVTNLGRVAGILRTAYVRCYLQRGKFPDHPIVDTSQLHLAQNAIAAGLTGTGYPPCQFEKPFSKQDWLDIAANNAVPVYTAILIYEGPLDYTYVDTVSYRIDPFVGGGAYPLGLKDYTNEQASPGRTSKGAELNLPNIIWKPQTPLQSK